MSGTSDVVKEIEVKNLGVFTAYANYAIKVLFEDRTIVRMQKGHSAVRILSKNGDDLLFNIESIARNTIAQRQY